MRCALATLLKDSSKWSIKQTPNVCQQLATTELLLRQTPCCRHLAGRRSLIPIHMCIRFVFLKRLTGLCATTPGGADRDCSAQPMDLGRQ